MNKSIGNNYKSNTFKVFKVSDSQAKANKNKLDSSNSMFSLARKSTKDSLGSSSSINEKLTNINSGLNENQRLSEDEINNSLGIIKFCYKYVNGMALPCHFSNKRYRQFNHSVLIYKDNDGNSELKILFKPKVRNEEDSIYKAEGSYKTVKTSGFLVTVNDDIDITDIQRVVTVSKGKTAIKDDGDLLKKEGYTEIRYSGEKTTDRFIYINKYLGKEIIDDLSPKFYYVNNEAEFLKQAANLADGIYNVSSESKLFISNKYYQILNGTLNEIFPKNQYVTNSISDLKAKGMYTAELYSKLFTGFQPPLSLKDKMSIISSLLNQFKNDMGDIKLRNILISANKEVTFIDTENMVFTYTSKQAKSSGDYNNANKNAIEKQQILGLAYLFYQIYGDNASIQGLVYNHQPKPEQLNFPKGSEHNLFKDLLQSAFLEKVDNLNLFKQEVHKILELEES